MKRTSWIVLGIIALLIIGLVILKIASVPRLSDEQQILQTLGDAQAAVNRRDTSAAMSFIARDYRDPAGNNRDRLRVLAIRAFRGSEHFSVGLENVSVLVDGKDAKVQMTVTVGMVDQASRNGNDLWNSPMELQMKKLPSHRWLVFPVEKWRITSISNLPGSELD